MKKLFQRILIWFYGLKLLNKLLISYAAFFLIPLCAFSMFTFRSFSDILRSNIIFSMDKSYKQSYSYLEDKLAKIENTSGIVLSDNNVNKIFELKRDNNWQASNYYTTRQTITFLSSLEDTDISRIVLYLYQAGSYPDISYSFNWVYNVKGCEWYSKISKNNLNILWCPKSYLNNGATSLKELNSNNFALIRRYKDPGNFSKTLGYFCLYFSTKPITDIIDMSNSVSGSVTYLQNSNGDLVYASNMKIYSQFNKPFENHSGDKNVTALLKTCRIDGKNVIFAKQTFKDSDWSLITIVPYDKVLSQVRTTQMQIAMITLLLSVLCLAFAWLTFNSITKRIGHLQYKMQQVQHGNLSPLSETPYTDEIGYLYSSYNFMMKEIDRLMDEKYKDGIQVKASELKALQAQIDPHFLYNTLDTISWLAQKNSIGELQKAITSLATFYKLSLSKGSNEIPIEDELKQVSSYVQIQNIRFSNGIFLIFDMDEEIKKYLILKLILQPFVENSIIHGIMSNPAKSGCVIIKAKIDSGTITVTIQDDGIGIPDETLRRLNDNSNDGDKGIGFGIRNVKKRLHLNYGPQYNVHFNSEIGRGTTVEFGIPAKYKDSEGK